MTPLTYRHCSAQQSATKFLGSSVYSLQENLLFFASSLIGLSPQLEGIRAFGTDDEQALIKAFRDEFAFSQHLTCFIHVHRNIKDKLNECHVPSHISMLICDDVFGRQVGDVFEEGLVDSLHSGDFKRKFESLFAKWSDMECMSSTNMDGFFYSALKLTRQM